MVFHIGLNLLGQKVGFDQQIPHDVAVPAVGAGVAQFLNHPLVNGKECIDTLAELGLCRVGQQEPVGQQGGHGGQGHIDQPEEHRLGDVQAHGGQGHGVAGAVHGHGPGGDGGVVHQAGDDNQEKNPLGCGG